MYLSNQSNRGFTLIELLMVVAIVGVLASVILSSLASARSRGNDAAAKTNLVTLRTQANVYYDTNSNYGTNAGAGAISLASCTLASSFFVLDTVVARAIQGADKAVGGTGSSKVQCAISATGTAQTWAVYVPLSNNSGSNTGWCIDSQGNSKADVIPTTSSCP